LGTELKFFAEKILTLSKEKELSTLPQIASFQEYLGAFISSPNEIRIMVVGSNPHFQ